ncbi:ankyrin repeat-containing protein [Cryptosporidium felis]|nr:ankyrin repeat-containing protein [Cryptosporidium felis]
MVVIELERPQGSLQIERKKFIAGSDGEFDELNHEIYEFIHQCLNIEDSDLLVPATGEDLRNSEKEKEIHVAKSPLSENREDFKFGLGGENYSSALNIKEGIQDLDRFSSAPFESSLDLNSKLLKASFLGRTEFIKSCLDNGASLLYTDKVGRTALHYAAACGWLPTMKLLLEYECDINRRDHKHWTALHIAVSKKFPEIVELLLSSGADYTLGLLHTCAPCRGGPISSKAIHFAAIRGNQEITKTLLKFGADINDRDEDEKTPLHYASFRSNSQFVTWLIQAGAEVDAKDKYGRAPIHIAALSGNVGIAKILVEGGAQTMVRDIWDMSPLSLAATREHPEMVSYLESITGESATAFSVLRGFELDSMESIVLNTIVTGLREPKKEFLARVIKTIGPQTSLELYGDAMKIENSGGLLTADGSRRKTIGGVFCHLLKQLVTNQRISAQEWNYIRQEEKERVNAKNILKRNNRRSQV